MARALLAAVKVRGRLIFWLAYFIANVVTALDYFGRLLLLIVRSQFAKSGGLLALAAAVAVWACLARLRV